MKISFTEFNVKATTPEEISAAKLFIAELNKRTKAPISLNEKEANFIFNLSPDFDSKSCYKITVNGEIIEFYGKTIRGLIFAFFHFLRKSVFKNGVNILTENIDGFYAPQKKIIGHQISYRTTPNTYDAWDYDQYFQYYLDIMAFGANTVEHNGTKPDKSFRNRLMKYEQYEFLAEATRLADTIDLDVSLWHANDDNETEEEALALREKLYSSLPRLDYVFPPGGDPGKLKADVFVDRCIKIDKVLKKYHPEAKMQPSAQAPHEYRDWGEVFVGELSTLPDEIDAVIMGPNHAFPIHELRKRIPAKYPMRFYPDITHNLRCEYPVNFLEDDWHFSYAATLSRESVNPRPTELHTLHRIFSPYTIGSVSYSEGVHDDLNKAVWSALEFNANTPLNEILLDYARCFMYGSDEEKIADLILLLEKNWQSAPEENPCIDLAYKGFCELKKDYPHLSENWRFTQLYFRACCDKLVKTRRIFELQLIKNAEKYLSVNDFKNALNELQKPFDESYIQLRKEIDYLGKKLFDLIGLQLDVENYCADSWERGATLETIDNNVTDRAFLLKKCEKLEGLSESEKAEYLKKIIDARKARPEEIYYSVALHNLNTLGTRQKGEFYMDIQADRPYTKEKPIPMAMTKLFDHFNFEAFFGGFASDCDYTLKVVYKSENAEEIEHHTITVNDTVIYDGKRYGGKKDAEFDEIFLVDGFESCEYLIPKSLIINGTINLKIEEATEGFKFCEFWIKKV